MILHISTSSSWRGGEQQVAYLASGLLDLGTKQVVLCPKGSSLATRLLEQDIPVTTFDDRGFLGLTLARKIYALCKKGKFTHIHCHDSHAHTSALQFIQLSGKNIPLIVSRRVAFPISKNPFSKWKYNHPAVKQIICVSNIVKEITTLTISNSSKISVIYDGIDVEKYHGKPEERKLFKALGLEESTFLIGNLSALSKSKDFPTFLHIASRVCAEVPKAQFIIAGEGPEKAKIEKIIRSLKLEGKIHLLGFRSDVVEVMQSLDLFLFTSTIEGLGTIVLEAFAAGVPVVATMAGGIPELVDDEHTGLLAAPGDVAALTTAVLRLIKQPEVRTQLTSAASEKVKAFSYQETAAQTLAVYQKIR